MKTAKRKILLTLLILVLLLPNISLAVTCTRADGTTYENNLNLCYPEFGGFRLELDWTSKHINELVAWFYYFIVSVGGIAAFVMLVWGGFVWLTSVGSPARIADAKDRIYSAFLGLSLILASYLIIQIINPELLMLNLPELPGPCAPGCDFLPMGPCLPGKPAMTPVSGGVCCCP